VGADRRCIPFLKLWCQLYSGEQCEDDTRPLVEYVISEGRATAQAPTERKQRPVRDIEEEMASLFTHGREQGCTLDQIRKALRLARASATSRESTEE
jgi:hypothetical protein